MMVSLMASAPTVICSELRIRGNKSRQYYVLNNNFELKNRHVSPALPVLRFEPRTFGSLSGSSPVEDA